jgi:hypothetical protein
MFQLGKDGFKMPVPEVLDIKELCRPPEPKKITACPCGTADLVLLWW